MNKRRIASFVILFLVITMIMVGCDKSTDTAIKSKLTITINSWVGFAPLYLAKEKGFFGNTNLELVRVEDTGARKATMIAGKVDGYASSLDNFAIDSSEGIKGKIVLCLDESFGADGIVVKKSIKDAKDLKGRKVAYQKGMPSHFLLLTVLDKNGFTMNDIMQIDLDGDKAGAAFASGKLDAAVTWEPWISKAAEMADGKILVTTRDYPGLIVDTLVFRDEILASKRAAISDVMSGWFKALEYWKTHKDESDEIMAKALGLKVSEFQGMVSGIRFFDLSKNKEFFGIPNRKGQTFDVFEKASDLWLKGSVIRSKSNPSDTIDPTFVNEAK